MKGKEKMHGICHLEIPSKNVADSAAFYGAVFGWETDVRGEGEYGVFRMGDGNEGGFDPSESPTESGILPYVEVADIPDTLAKIEAAGGKVIRQKTPVGGPHGFYALFADPHGNRLGIWAKE